MQLLTLVSLSRTPAGENQTNVELSREEDFAELLRQEEAAIRRMCDDIAAFKPDVVITEKVTRPRGWLVHRFDYNDSEMIDDAQTALHWTPLTGSGTFSGDQGRRPPAAHNRVDLVSL